MESERENLVRVNDILTELERQGRTVGETVRDRKNLSLRKKGRVKDLDVNMFLLEMERIETQTKEVEEKFKIADTQLKRRQRGIREYQSGV